MKDQFIEIYNARIQREGADKLLAWLESTDFFKAPASTRFHLSREGGLVEHSIHVYDRLRELLLNEKQRNGLLPTLTDQEEETAAICGLLHDLCKVGVYHKEPKNQKTYDPEKVKKDQKYQVKHDSMGDFIWETVMGYKFEEDLVYGHGEKSVYIISGFMHLTREEAMAIRWHMGFSDNDFKAGGQSVGKAFDKFPLAVMTHIADLMASHLDETKEA